MRPGSRPVLAFMTFVAFTNYCGGGYAIATALYENPQCGPAYQNVWLSVGSGAFWPVIVASKVLFEAPGPCEPKPA